VTRTRIPDEVLSVAHDRSKARAARDWATADRLRGEIEAAGWKVIDTGTDFRLEPAHPADVAEEGRVRYGSSASVPSRLDEAAVGVASVVIVATDWPEDVARTVGALADTNPDGTQVVIAADDPSEAQAAALEMHDAADPGAPGVMTEVVWTSARLGHAAALNAGIRRARAEVVVVVDSSVEPTGDIVSPLVAVLDDPTVAIAGPFGVVSDDLRSFREAPPGEVDAIEGYCMAFRRLDYAQQGPLDEHFRFYRNLDIWWSLVLRDAGRGGPHRRAVMVDGLPLVRHEHRGSTRVSEDERTRLSKRNFYRLLDRFRGRDDLLTTAGR
jgi:GT2 family glycosyltransferase